MAIKLVTIPTYNERENVERMIHTVMALPSQFEVLIIDDNSPDGTAGIVKSLMLQFPNRLHILERAGKQGLGKAYLAGFEWALKHGADYIFEMDCDFSHNPNDLEKLLQACENDGADVAIGSRYIRGINVINWPLGRVLMSYFASMYVRIITGMKIMDCTAGFKCFRREVLEVIDLEGIKLRGYGFQIEMKFTAQMHGFNLVEVPIIFTDRQEGTSKMSGGIFNEAFWGVIKMKIRSWFRKYEQKAKLHETP
ncbi:MAG: polyprenol monophosphomannose synthase [Mangrovibacterium sp.]